MSSTVDTVDVSSTSQSHPIGFWFFFWGEFAERCSYYGMRAILALYMTQKLGVSQADAGTFMSLFIAACYFFPLIGGWVADNLLGKYWTIVLFSAPYVIAQFIVGIEDRSIVVLALILLAMGSGVIKPNISTLMGMTYDQQRPGQNQLRTSAFSWFYMAINIGAFMSQVSMPYLRNEYGYQVAFLFPAVLMAIALIIFAMGKRYYAQESIVRKVIGDPGQSPPPPAKTLTGVPVTTVIVTELEKAEDFRLKLTTLSRIGLLFLTVMFFWAIFDQSASTWIFFANTFMDCHLFGVLTPPDSIQAFNPLFIVALVPLSVMFFKQFPMKATTKIGLGYALTAISMIIMSFSGFMAGEDRQVTKLIVPEGTFILPDSTIKLAELTDGKLELGANKMVATDSKYDEGVAKLKFRNATIETEGGKTVTITGGHITSDSLEHATSNGVLESIVKTPEELKKIKPEPVDATLETASWVPPNERVTVWWQVLAYLILTVAEILVSITGLELAFVAAPASMKSFVTACWLAVVFLANTFNAYITRLYEDMPPGTYFAMLAGGILLVLLVYAPIASQFNRKVMEQPVA